MDNIYVLAIGILIIALLFRRFSRRASDRSGIPGDARIFYSDTNMKRIEKPLFSDKYKLSGKPDYVIQKETRNGRKAVVPVEVKPKRMVNYPYESDVMQLGAYMLLVEDFYSTDVPFGILKYKTKKFEIANTNELKSKVFELMRSLRSNASSGDEVPICDDKKRCQNCGYRKACT